MMAKGRQPAKINITVHHVAHPNPQVAYDLLSKLALREVQEAEAELRSAKEDQAEAASEVTGIERQITSYGIKPEDIDQAILSLGEGS